MAIRAVKFRVERCKILRGIPTRTYTLTVKHGGKQTVQPLFSFGTDILKGDTVNIAIFENVYYYDRKITFEDWSTRLNVKAEPSEWFSDGVHPSKLTYQTWAKDISAFICGHKDIINTLKTVGYQN